MVACHRALAVAAGALFVVQYMKILNIIPKKRIITLCEESQGKKQPKRVATR